MKKLTLLLFPFLLLNACAESSNTDEKHNEKSKTTEVETNQEAGKEDAELTQETEPNESEDTGNSLAEYGTIESYAKLNTKEKLVAAFGEGMLSDGVSWYAEGTVEMKHTILTDPTTNHFIKFLWSQSNPEKLSSIEVDFIMYDEDYEQLGVQTVYSDCGLFTGMTLKELYEWNGNHIHFAGFGWDYAGGIFDTDVSKISKCKMQIILSIDYDNWNEKDVEVDGDIELSTEDEVILNAPIFVEQMIYSEIE